MTRGPGLYPAELACCPCRRRLARRPAGHSGSWDPARAGRFPGRTPGLDKPHLRRDASLQASVAIPCCQLSFALPVLQPNGFARLPCYTHECRSLQSFSMCIAGPEGGTTGQEAAIRSFTTGGYLQRSTIRPKAPECSTATRDIGVSVPLHRTIRSRPPHAGCESGPGHLPGQNGLSLPSRAMSCPVQQVQGQAGQSSIRTRSKVVTVLADR